MAKKSLMGRKLDKANIRIGELEDEIDVLNVSLEAQKAFSSAMQKAANVSGRDVRLATKHLRGAAELLKPSMPTMAAALIAQADVFDSMPEDR